jgi:hypothetical protein
MSAEPNGDYLRIRPEEWKKPGWHLRTASKTTGTTSGGIGGHVCAACSEPIPQKVRGSGNEKYYCSGACRSRAWRGRRKEAHATTAQ